MDRHARFVATSRFESLDGLRALAIVPVVWHHATPYPLEGVLGRGPLGVDLFFAVSGFLITTLLLREREATGRIALGPFWVRRSLRIFPLYYLVLGLFVLHAVFLRATGPVRTHFLASVPFYATYTSNWLVDWNVGHPIVFAFAWSLATEEQFYLFWPWLLRARRLALPAAAMLALIGIDQLAERGLFVDGFAGRVARSFATPIGTGSLLAIALRWRPSFRVLDAVLGHRWSSAAALAGLAIAAIQPWSLLPTHLTMTALVGAVCLRADHLLRPLFEARAVRHVGLVSYGVYLLNVPVVSAARGALGAADQVSVTSSTLGVFVLGLAGSVAVATISYRLVERPLLGLRERFRPAQRASLSGASFHSVSSGTRASGPDCRTTRAHSSAVSRRGPNGEESEASESIKSVGVSTP